MRWMRKVRKQRGNQTYLDRVTLPSFQLRQRPFDALVVLIALFSSGPYSTFSVAACSKHGLTTSERQGRAGPPPGRLVPALFRLGERGKLTLERRRTRAWLGQGRLELAAAHAEAVVVAISIAEQGERRREPARGRCFDNMRKAGCHPR